jgi:hypothetical protein
MGKAKRAHHQQGIDVPCFTAVVMDGANPFSPDGTLPEVASPRSAEGGSGSAE